MMEWLDEPVSRAELLLALAGYWWTGRGMRQLRHRLRVREYRARKLRSCVLDG